ncbi:ABC transporter ATP-binding protein [Amycolatopsis pigmentata]|uniref:ABC transporter ATP-binding protein n=1 Tax=Amycolatopsis pigmentata TaxID=450801 RepID=A0ABW5FRP0_9PSEU
MSNPGEALLVDALKRDRARVGLLLLCTAVSTAAGLVLPGALAAAVDSAIAGALSWPKVAWFFAVGAGEIATSVLTVLLTATTTAAASAWLRRRLADRLLALGSRSDFAAGDALSRLTGDCANAGAIAPTLMQLGSAVVFSVGAVALLTALDWRLAVVFVASVPVALVIARSHMRFTADDVLAYQRVSGELSARLLDALRGLRTIAASGTADRETRRVLEPLPRLGAAGTGIWRTQAKMVWRAALLLPAVEVTVLLAAGFGVQAGRLSAGQVLAALGYVALGMTLVSRIPLLTTLARISSCARRIAEVLDAWAPGPGTRGVPPGPGTVELWGVTVPGALDGVDLIVPGGSSVAVVGRSGSGKSVLLAVLGGLQAPERGQVLLDGVPIGELYADELHAAIAYAFERPALLGTTVADAVSYGTVADDDEVAAACRAAQVHDLVVRLPDGYHNALRETPLSGGEAQRLGLARAIVRRPRVLITDDATASLDTVTESIVDSAVRGAAATRVSVTHRAVTAGRADLVAWLDNGRIRALAPHAVLWADPDYRAVFEGADDGEIPAMRTDHEWVSRGTQEKV